MIVLKKIMTIVALCMATCTLWAQNEVSLVVSGEGKDKEEATFKALRSAIEQAYGTFVSANTTVLNDQLVADEIVSLSSGNIKKYEYVSENKMPNGNTFVTLSATVSIDKLVSFAESKGMEAELKGALFAMNIKKMEFDKQAEEKAVENLCKQLETMLPTLFDYEITVEEPKMVKDQVSVGFSVNIIPNTNLDEFIKTLCKTTSQIALDYKALDNYTKSGYRANPILFFSPLLYNLKDVLAKNGFKDGLNKFLNGSAGKQTSFQNTGDRLLIYSSDISRYKKICSELGVDCQLIRNPNYSQYGSDRQLQLIEISPFYLRSPKSIQLLNSFYNKVVQTYYNIVISTGIKDIEVKVHSSDNGYSNACDFSDILVFEADEGVKILNRCTFAGTDWTFSQWPISMEHLQGVLFFTQEEIAKVTNISVSKTVMDKQ